MNRSKLLKALRANGFSEETPTLENVKAFIESQGIELNDADGPVDIAKAWNAKAKVTVEDDATPAPEKKSNSEAAKKAFGRVAQVVESKGETKALGFNIGNLQRKAFENKVASGQSFVKDADTAELLGASFRLAAMEAKGVESYSQKSRDVEILKAMNTYNNAEGGYLVPPAELVSELIYNGEPTGVARKVANVVRMGGSQVSFARETADVTLPVLAEGGTLTAISPAFDRVNLSPRKAGGYFESTMEELEDSAFNVGDIVMRKSAIAWDNRIDEDYFNGDGTPTYNNHVGLKSSSAKVTSVNASGAAWTNVVYGDILKAMGTLQGASWGNVQILCSRQFALQVLANLNIATSQFKNVFELSADKTGGMFLGTPVIFSQRMPIATAGTTRFMYIGDFKNGSMVGERRDLTIRPDQSSGLATDSFRWYVTGRYAVNVCGHGRTDLTNQNIVALTTT